jgi:hypothetical protein
LAHLSDGTLRRMYDEPVAVAATAREHFNACTPCQDRFAAVAETAREIQAAMAVPAAAVNAGAGYRATMARVTKPRLTWLPRVGFARRRRSVMVGLLAAALALGVTVTAVAVSMTPIFEPTQVQTVAITAGSFQGFPDLSNWGTVKTNAQPELKPEDTAALAAKDSNLGAINPKNLPSGLPAAQYATVGLADVTFTFDKAKADAAAAKAGAKAPPLPSSLNNASLEVKGGPAEVAVYGSIDPKTLQAGNLPQLVIGEAHAPVVSSSGASVNDIKKAILSQPGVSKQLKAEINSIGDPTNTLPIPIPVDKVDSHTVALHDSGRTKSKTGTKATYVGDPNTKIYAAVIFVRDHVVYVVAGSYDENTLVDIASSL